MGNMILSVDNIWNCFIEIQMKFLGHDRNECKSGETSIKSYLNKAIIIKIIKQ